MGILENDTRQRLEDTNMIVPVLDEVVVVHLNALVSRVQANRLSSNDMSTCPHTVTTSHLENGMDHIAIANASGWQRERECERE